MTQQKMIHQNHRQWKKIRLKVVVKVQAMQDSNQRYVERRGLRVKLCEMQRNIQSAEDGDAIEDQTLGTFEQFRK